MMFPLATEQFLAILLMAVPTMPSGETLQPKTQPGDSLFDTARVIRLHLEMTAKQFDSLSPKQGPGGFGGFGPPGFGRPKPPAGDAHRNTFGIDLPWSSGNLTVSNGEESVPLKEIGIRHKGNYNYIAAASALKKSFKLDMNRHVPGQKLDGLTMLNLHGGLSDPSRARESLSYAFFRATGVPAPRTCLAELTLTVPAAATADDGIYTVVASGPGGTATSAAMPLTVLHTYATWVAGFGAAGAPANGDLDGDGISNLAEFIANTNPLSAASTTERATHQAVGGVEFAAGVPANLTLEFRLNRRAAFTGLGAEVSSDLGTWSPASPTLTELVGTESNGDQRWRFKFAVPGGTTKRFIRLSIAE